MVLPDAALNGFASALSERLATRASGMDDDSARIRGLRPADQILAGFLTPMRDPGRGPAENRRTPEALDALLVEDLPQDSAYEQTAVGFEWLAPRAALIAGATLAIGVRAAVYARRLPTFDEERAHAGRTGVRTPWRQRSAPPGPEGTVPAREYPLLQVWTRHEPATVLTGEIDLGTLLRAKRQTIDLAGQLGEALDLGGGLVPRGDLRVPEAALDDEDAYQRWLGSIATKPALPQWRPVVDARVVVAPADPGNVRIALRVINRTRPLERSQEEYLDPNLYAVDLAATFPVAAHRMMTFRELPQSYRYDRSMPGVGINAHVGLAREGDLITLTSDTVPREVVQRTEPRQLPDAPPRFDRLADAPIPLLRAILARMRDYDANAWEGKCQHLSGAELDEARGDRARFRREIAAFERGVALLDDERYPAVRRSFALMNRAMARLGRKSRAGFAEWRLFQIAFIVSRLPSLAAREYPELGEAQDDDVDLLWFAAGGGKTEAFLGIILWQAFFDRLRGKRVGVTAFVRFPLRLLTFQQLQRLARALGEAELVRKEEGLSGARFSLGYFVGGGVTNNRIDDDAHRRYAHQGPDDRHKVLFQCPFCGEATRLGYDKALRLIEHHCERADCPGGEGRLPVYVVDADLYRYLPTIIVSTVDKLAMLGQNQRFANLLGRIDMVCPVHGASFRDNNAGCEAAMAWAKGERPERCGNSSHRIQYGPFKDAAPALLVQDELHLLSEELGTFDAHYETAAVAMMRSLGFRPWHVIAATATIQDYRSHTWQLYLRGARQFPAPGPEAYESFYYVLNPGRIGRIFIGLIGVGRKHTPSVSRALTIVYLELEDARRLAAHDPAAAAARYGTPPLDAAQWQRLIFLYELPLAYALTRKGSDQVAEAIESRVKKDIQEIAPEHGELLIRMFNSGVDVPDMMDTMEQIRAADPSSPPAGRTRGLVTTNIIGHGVDVDRFNIMIFAGFPRLVAEYIQASARVGRTYPGLSIFVATPQSERDRGVFNRFVKFHEYLDRLVDPSAVARWPLPALNRTVPGILAGYLMGVAAEKIGHGLSTVERIKGHHGEPGAGALDPSVVGAWMREAYGVDEAPSGERYVERLDTTVQRFYAMIINAPERSGGYTAVNSHLGAMQSLRDIDDPGDIRVDEKLDRTVLRRLLRGGA